MAWTEESIVAEFRTHIAYWQEKLRLRDIRFRVLVMTNVSTDSCAWAAVVPDNYGANPYGCVVKIKRGAWEEETQRTVWMTCAHELVHVMNWSMSRAFEPLVDHFATAQINMAKSLMSRGDEKLAYKWESILTDWFKADAPPDTVPDDVVAVAAAPVAPTPSSTTTTATGTI